MNALTLVSPRAALVACATAALAFGPLAGAAEADALPKFESYIKVSGQAASISGSDSSYQKRARGHVDGAVGLEDLHIYKDLSKTTSLTIDGRALAGPEDYLGQFKIVKENVGSFEAGYKRTRTFYDGIGGFFPLNRGWFALSEPDLHIDRGNLWVEGKLAFKDAPVFTVRYTNDTRNGKKDSTIWGDTNLTGLPLLPTNNATRKILPAYRWVGERREVLEGKVEHTVGGTKVALSLLGEWNHNLNRFYVRTFVGEGATERNIQQADGINTHGFSTHLTTETPLSKQLSLNTGWGYQKVGTGIYGERALAVGLAPTFSYKDMAGGSNVKIYTGNVALAYRPDAAWLLQAALRGEDSYIKTVTSFTSATQPRGQPITAPITVAFNNADSRVKEKNYTPEFNVRYTGIAKTVLYGAFSKRTVDGDDRATTPYAVAVPASTNLFYDKLSQDQLHYTLGANLNISSALILRGEVFQKDHENKFTGYANHVGGLYVVGYDFTGIKLTAIWKPVPQLSFTTRYQPQKGTMDVTTEATAKFDSMDAKSHLIGETVTWSPNKNVYLQGGVNLSYNYISTAYPRAGGLGNLRGQNSDNNYVSCNFLSGFAVDKATDATIEYVYTKADNFVPEQAVGTQPYGAGFTDYTVSVGVKHKFSDKWVGSAKIGYTESRNDTTGGNTNFRGPLAYIAIEHGL